MEDDFVGATEFRLPLHGTKSLRVTLTCTVPRGHIHAPRTSSRAAHASGMSPGRAPPKGASKSSTYMRRTVSDGAAGTVAVAKRGKVDAEGFAALDRIPHHV